MPADYEHDPRPAMFEYQPPAILNQAAPVQNTWYIALPQNEFVRVYLVAVNVAAPNETLEVRAEVDGEAWGSAAVLAVGGTDYYGFKHATAIGGVDAIALDADLAFAVRTSAFLLEGHNVNLEVRKTTAAGAGNLRAVVLWGILTET